MNSIKELREHFTKLKRLEYILALLGWDQQVYMPKGAVKARAEQIALIKGMIHKKLISPKTGKMISNAEKLKNLNLIDSAILREAKREYEQAIKLPMELVCEIAKTAVLGHQAWEKAREKSEFSIFQQLLGKMIGLQIEMAEKLDTGPSLYSSLLDLYEPGATADWVSRIFNNLSQKLGVILEKLHDSSDKPNQSILKKFYDSEKQWKFSMEILKRLNFNFDIGRQDKSVHPFTTSLSSMDTRITTRISENSFPDCLFGTIHECGHALYEMGFKEEIHDTILSDGSSLGIHESQSRLWENFVGRSREFWIYWYPILQKYFPENLKNYPLEDFYRSINTVRPSFIRVEADEVTYGLHVILRFEIERKLIEGEIQVSELPSSWNEKTEQLLGIIPPNDAKGVLQDVHWSGGAFGYFPTYTLGNLYAAQIYSDALKKHPSLPEEFNKGKFSNLLAYLKEEVHQHGKIYRPLELLKKITREELNPNYFINYLEKKFYSIYKI
ncbi:MAG: carboxypeptidase M32 [Promethearchaeota archaeon]